MSDQEKTTPEEQTSTPIQSDSLAQSEAESTANKTVQVDDTTTSVDPFAKLKKKQVAVAKEMGTVHGKVKRGSKISPKVFLVGCGMFFILFLGLVYA